MSDVKYLSSTEELHRKLLYWSAREDGGIPSVEVKFVDIRRNTESEGGYLAGN